MKTYFRKFIAKILIFVMVMSLVNIDAVFVKADAEGDNYVTCVTLKEGVNAEETAETYTYNGYRPDLGDKFSDVSGHSMTYYVSRSVYNEETKEWGEASAYKEIVVGFASTLAEYAVTEDKSGIYKYSWKGYCKTEGKLSDATYTVILKVVNPEETTYEMTFYVGQDIAGAGYNPVIKLYPTTGTDSRTGYDTFDASEEIILKGGELDVSNQYRVYTASLKGGAYSYRAWGYDSKSGTYTNALGGMSVRIPMASNVTQSGYDQSSVYIRTAAVGTQTKYDGTNYLNKDQYTTEVVCPYYNCNATPGTPYVSNGITYYPYMLVAQGNACLYNYYAYPSEEIAEEYNLIFGYGINATVVKGHTIFTTWRPSIASRITSAITVPSGAEAEVYFQMNNFRDMEIESYDHKDNGDGTTTWYFYVPKNNGNYTYRVSKEGYVTKAGYMSLGSEASATFSVELDRKDVKSHDFSDLQKTVSARDEANLIMNVSDSNYKNINVGETFRLRAYRVWEIVNSDAGNIMIEPDFNYEVLSGQDCISIEKVEDNRTNGKGNWIDIKGKSTGTAVIAVTYDAINVDGTTTHGGLFPAISPKRTGVVVIHVGEDTSDITDLGIKNTKENDWSWNYDTFYFIAPEIKGTMDIAPVASSGIADVEVATVQTDDALNSKISGWSSVSKKDGTYNLPLTEGNNIVKITSNAGNVAYQVIRAAQLKVDFSNQSNPGEEIMPGDQVQISFEGFYRTIPKISGIFNPITLQVKGTGSDNTEFTGSIAQYQVADRATFEVSIPKDIAFEEGSETTTYTISDGYIYLQSMYSYADAWKFMYTLTDEGIGTCFNAVINTGSHTTISDIDIPVSRKVLFDVDINVKDQDGNKIDAYNLTVIDPEENEVTDFSGLGYGTYSYHVESDGYVVKDSEFKLSSATESEDGKTSVDIILEKAAENAWDGKTYTEPETDKEGTYLIGTGSELAWFSKQVNESTVKTTSVLNAKLTADIDLAGYQWPQIGYYTSASAYVYYGGTFDGDKHSINNLKINKHTDTTTAFYSGLFAYTNGATIKNVAVDGDITVGSTKSVSNAYLGAFSGYAVNTTFDNITSNVDIEIKRVSGNYQYIGGICGYTKGTTNSFANVKNTGNISGYNYVGGIVGQTENGMEKVENTGKINGNNYVGGITGRFGSSFELTEACNKGEINASSYVGGIIGQMSTANGRLSKAVNEGNVIVTGGYAAGIIGSSSVLVHVSDCINIADITGSDTGYIGSIAGYVYGNAGTTFDNCISFGKVTAPKSDYEGDAFGYVRLGMISNCFAIGQLGKVIGKYDDTVAVTDCGIADTEKELLYEYATGKNFDGYSDVTIEMLNNKLLSYVSVLKDSTSTINEKMEQLEFVKSKINFEKLILQNEKVNVTVSVQSDNKFIAAPFTVRVNGYTAESFGFDDSVENGVSVLDILVAAHVRVYGADFGGTTAEDYLTLSSSFVTKAFEKEGSTFMFTVDGSMPNNGVLDDYGYYTSYPVDQAVVNDNQKVDFYFCQDTTNYRDHIAWIETKESKVTAGEGVAFQLKGYSLMWYGSCEASVIAENTVPIAGAKLGIVDEHTGEIMPLSESVTDGNGLVTVKFDKAGTYTVTAFTDGNSTPIFMPIYTVNVEEQETKPNVTTAPAKENMTTPATKVKVKAPNKAKINKVNTKKKSAKKIKLTLKKISGAKGYQVAIYKAKANAKKNKKAIVKKFVKKVKVTVTSKKLKNRNKLYVKVRAYKLDGKTKVYGKWSKVKKVKIK